MESSLMQRALRQLLSHQTCSRLRYTLPLCRTPASQCVLRPRYASGGPKAQSAQASSTSHKTRWSQREYLRADDRVEAYRKAPIVTADDLRTCTERPRNVKMLMRDFIEDSLYNPQYGYFPKEATIFALPEPIQFDSIENELDFHDVVGRQYMQFEDELDRKQYNEARQLWHTPTELFKPYYGEALAQYLVTNYKLSDYPHNDLIIYELGAGNGTLMLNILDFIRQKHPEVYSRTRYKIIEISPALASLQATSLRDSRFAGTHAEHVEIINQSIFSWNKIVPAPCFVLALEVLDNLAHDLIRYDQITEKPVQGTVLIDNDGHFFEYLTPELDPLARQFLKARHTACRNEYRHPIAPTHTFLQRLRTSLPFVRNEYRHPLRGNAFLRKFRASLPFAPSYTAPEYIPTRIPQLFRILTDFFPLHRLLVADFHSLPNAIPGVNAPVVQTRYRRQTVPVTTPLVMQGYFDILFPTDFTMLEDLYRATTGKLTRLTSQAEWLEHWADTERTTCRNGENPMLTWYQNASVMVST